MPTYSLSIDNPDGSVTHLGVILGVSGEGATEKARERITRRQDELDPKGKVVLTEKDTGALFYEGKDAPTVEAMIAS